LLKHPYCNACPDFSVSWNENIVFAVMDNLDRVLMESYENSPALYDLIKLVRNKAAGIDDLLNDLLED
jgi:hypothetical protein